jgi:predicted RND superfamily exporter protein
LVAALAGAFLAGAFFAVVFTGALAAVLALVVVFFAVSAATGAFFD